MKLPSKTSVISNSFGFTIMEILVVITIIAILTGLTIPTFGSYLRNQNLRMAQDQVVVDLRKIQNRALSNVGYVPGETLYWGVRFDREQGSYVFFIVDPTATTLNLGNECNRGGSPGVLAREQSAALPDNTVIRTSAGYYCVFFDFNKGNIVTSPPGIPSVIIGRPGETGNNCLSVSLSNAGQISGVQATVTCPN